MESRSLNALQYLRVVEEPLSELVRDICEWEGLDLNYVFQKPHDMREILKNVESKLYGKASQADKTEKREIDQIRTNLRWMRHILNMDAHTSVRAINKNTLALGLASAIDIIFVDLDKDCSNTYDQFSELSERLYRTLFEEYTEKNNNQDSELENDQLHALNEKIDRGFTLIAELATNLTQYTGEVMKLVYDNRNNSSEEKYFYTQLNDKQKNALLLELRKKIEAHFRKSGVYLKAYEHIIQYRKIENLISSPLSNISDISNWAKSNIRGYETNKILIDEQIRIFGGEIVSILNNRINNVELEMRIGKFY